MNTGEIYEDWWERSVKIIKEKVRFDDFSLIHFEIKPGILPKSLKYRPISAYKVSIRALRGVFSILYRSHNAFRIDSNHGY